MVTNSRIAATLTGWFSFALLATSIGVALAARFWNWDIQAGTFVSLCLIGGWCVWYAILGRVLGAKSQRWSIYLLRDDDGLRQFSGTPLLGLVGGQLWRIVVLSMGIQPLARLLKAADGPDSDLVTDLAIDLIAFLSTSFLAWLWLLKYQYGNFKLIRTLDGQTTENPKRIVTDNPSTPASSSGHASAISDSVASIRSVVGGVLSTVAVASYLLLGVVQFAALYAFLGIIGDGGGLQAFLRHYLSVTCLS